MSSAGSSAAAHRPAIAAHRLVGDGHGALLVRPDAEIDWWCAPCLDSTPLCWSLLDGDGGRARFVDVRYAQRSDAPAGPAAVTVVTGDCGRMEVQDALLVDEPGGERETGAALVRLVRALDADLDVVHELRLAGFGRAAGCWRLDGGSARGSVDTRRLRVTGGCPAAHGPTLRSRLRAGRGRWAALLVRVTDGQEPADGAVLRIGDHGLTLPPDTTDGLTDGLAEDLAGVLAAATAEHERWLRHCRPPARHQQRATDALRVLRACTYAPTGATVAAVTTSLPEAPGHDRQFDYRFSWLRDASLAVSVASLLGQRGDAERYLRFIHSITGDRVVPSGPLVDIRGQEVSAEREVPAVAGWGGSRPVRTGNAAREQLQFDALGLLIEAVWTHVQAGARLDRATWRLVRELADLVADTDPHQARPSSGVWEFREERPLVVGDVGRWLALDRATRLGRWHRPLRSLRVRRRWVAARDTIAARVRAAVTPDGLLPQSYGQDPPRPDASALMAVVFGLLDPRGEPARLLVRRTVERLGAYPFVYRYPPDARDEFAGSEGAFVPVSFWAVTASALTGDLAGAQERMDDLCRSLPRLLSEEVDPADGSALGNVPLVWSHMELARALYVLDAVQRRARWGRLGAWLWQAGRYLRLRLS